MNAIEAITMINQGIHLKNIKSGKFSFVMIFFSLLFVRVKEVSVKVKFVCMVLIVPYSLKNCNADYFA